MTTFFKWIYEQYSKPISYNQSDMKLIILIFLKQAHAWFLKIDPVQIVCMRACVCVCVHARGY